MAGPRWQSRDGYDEEIGVVQRGGGLVRPEPAPLRPGWDPADAIAGMGALDSGELLAALGALADWLSPIPRASRRRARDVTVPDVRGLFSGPCQDALARAGFRIATVRLTDKPVPVEGLVVDQLPAPGSKVPRFSTMTVQVWHPPSPRPPGQ
jgi:PASTA domain